MLQYEQILAVADVATVLLPVDAVPLDHRNLVEAGITSNCHF